MARFERKNWREILLLRANPVIKALTVSDIFIVSGFGLASPIFAVFLTENIKGGSLEVVGLAATIYLLTKSLAQLPAAEIIDRIKGERDDFGAMFFGSMAVSFVPLLYLVARTPIHIYFIQFLYGLSQAFTFPSWMAIFTRHIDRQKEGLEWGTYYTLVDLSAAATAVVGGFLADKLGFGPVFVLVSLFSFVGSFWLLFCYRYTRRPKI